ncbi:MAG: DUF4357 domain-containing protein [Brachymonas sp.]|nr:DUF4357 domain-containing protein [Brachymonas sp.]
MLGRSSNGRTEWQDSDGRTLKALQEAEAGQHEVVSPCFIFNSTLRSFYAGWRPI